MSPRIPSALLRAAFVAAFTIGLAACATVSAPPPMLSIVPEVPLMQAVVQQLSADEFEGRAPASAAEPKVLDAIVARFRDAGLQPANGGSWLQEVPIVEITNSNRTPLAIAGGGVHAALAFGDDYGAASFRPVATTRVSDSELVFVGHGVVAPDLGWNDYAGVDMRGKTAIILSNDPDWFAADESGSFGGRRMTYYGRTAYKYEEAARQGAAAALIVHEPVASPGSWTIARTGFLNARRYLDEGEGEGAAQTLANGIIRDGALAEVLKPAGFDLAALTAAARIKGFRPVPLGLTASFGFDNAVHRAKTHNVVGLLPGTARKDEYVVYGAHWDHLGRCPADASGDAICNGAVDNATGIGALTAIAAANVRAGRTPRSQVFAAWTLEESGLLGSRWYAEHPVFPLAQTAANVNIDAIEPGGRARDYTMRGGDKSQLTAIFRAAIARMGLVESPEARPEEGRYYRSDHFSFAKVGVPAFRVVHGDDQVIGGTAAGEAATRDYNSRRYHRPGDEYSPDWNWDGIVQDVTLLANLGRTVAVSRAWPNWNPGGDFRQVRDRTCAAARKFCGSAR